MLRQIFSRSYSTKTVKDAIKTLSKRSATIKPEEDSISDPKMLQFCNSGSSSGNPFASIAELRIRQAMQKGDFKNLAKKGKPLTDEDMGVNYPFVETQQFLLNRIMATQNCLPPFIEQSKIIDEDTAKMRERLRKFWIKDCDRNDQHPRWLNVKARFSTTIENINDRVNFHNITLPTPVLPEKMPINFQKELERLLTEYPPDPKHSKRHPEKAW